MRFLFIAIIGIALLASCNNNSNSKQSAPSTDNLSSHHIEVIEVLQPGGYTYLLVSENDMEYWIAVERTEARVGDDFYYEKGMEMKGFTSKELDRTFESILFIDKLSTVPILAKPPVQTTQGVSGKKTTQENEILFFHIKDI